VSKREGEGKGEGEGRAGGGGGRKRGRERRRGREGREGGRKEHTKIKEGTTPNGPLESKNMIQPDCERGILN
jgi:hypothetical protein